MFLFICGVQGFGKLSLVAASAAQSAATVVQAGTKEFSSKVFGTSLISICTLFLIICRCFSASICCYVLEVQD